MDSAGRAGLASDLRKRGIELGDQIGRGAMSVVFHAQDVRHDRSLAVKVLQPAATDGVGTGSLMHEIRAVARLRHPGILPLIDSGTTDDGIGYFLMPFAEGDTLRQRMEQGPLPVAEAVRYAREVAEALAYAHGEAFVHCDVKPENILLEGGRAVLADFGLARRMDREPGPSFGTAQPGLAVGTPAYMSPEQLTSDAPLDGRSDLFSLGVTLYESLCGQLPFPSQFMPGLLAERLAGEFTPLSARRPGVPPLLDEIVARALAPDPAARYARGEEMAADLGRLERQLEGPVAELDPTPGAASRGRRAAVAGGIALVVLLTAAFLVRRAEANRLDPNRIAVADFRNETGDSTLDGIGRIAGDWISAGLMDVPGLTVFNSDYVLGAASLDSARGPSSDAILRALVDSTHAAAVVSGSYYREAGGVRVFVQLLDAHSGQVLLDLGPIHGSAARPDSMLARIRDSVTAFVRTLRTGPPPPVDPLNSASR